jgi:hypothetical protein
LGYKPLFAHPELVRDLIAHFTPFSALGALDAAAFEQVNPAYVSGEPWLYIYILLAFQSRSDRWMALRMQVPR